MHLLTATGHQSHWPLKFKAKKDLVLRHRLDQSHAKDVPVFRAHRRVYIALWPNCASASAAARTLFLAQRLCTRGTAALPNRRSWKGDSVSKLRQQCCARSNFVFMACVGGSILMSHRSRLLKSCSFRSSTRSADFEWFYIA